MGQTDQDVLLKDLASGIPESELAEGSILDGMLNDERIVLVRSGGKPFAVGGLCTHYGASQAGGVVDDGGIRCPLHHACIDLRTGAATCAPALSAIPSYDVVEAAGVIRVGAKRAVAGAPTSESTKRSSRD